jgi:hypothetical protein
MTVLKDACGVIGLRCDSAGCPRRLLTADLRIPRTTYGVRKHASSMGWSADTIYNAMLGNPRLADYCAVCGPRRAAIESPCALCTGGALFDLLGHNALGHRSARSLLRAGHDTPDAARALTWREINDLFQVALVQAHHIWETLHPGVDVPELPRTHPNVCRHGRKTNPQFRLV